MACLLALIFCPLNEGASAWRLISHVSQEVRSLVINVYTGRQIMVTLGENEFMGSLRGIEMCF